MIRENVKAKQAKEPQYIIMKQGFPRNREMKPGGLIWMIDNISFQVPEVPAGLVEKSVPVPWRSAEIPEVREYKKQDPK